MNANAQCSTSSNCPTSEELRQLLDRSLPSDGQDKCTSHLDSCTCCQAKLEEIATEGSGLAQVVNQLHETEPMATSAYWPALSALTSDGGPAVAAKPVVRTRTRSLDFLEPASDPAFLGRLGQFDVMRVLGQGGMGLVVEAFDTRLQRNVALKILDPQMAEDSVARQRFCREARAAASITHENVVAVHQVEKASEEGLPYLVMQLVAGESLEERLRRVKQLPIREVVRIGLQASQGLAAAHAQGLVHRDIKPGNILLEKSTDRVKLTDFGLARVVDDAKLTRTGFVTGTPLYMAPEQALGGEADMRSDLFSLGAVLYEMCAGQPPFAGNSAPVILKQIVEARQRPLKELNPAVPQWLSVTIDRLLAKKPADRIQSANLVAELFEFEWALMKTSSEEVPTVCEDEQRRRVRRSRIMAGVVGAACLALGVLGGMLFAPRGAPAMKTVASTSEPVAVLTANAGAVSSVAFNPAGDTVAMALEDGSVRLWDLSTKSVKNTLSAHRGTVWSARFSHKGDLLATAGDDGLIRVWNPAKLDPLRTIEEARTVRGLVFSRDDQSIYAGDSGGALRVSSLAAEHVSTQSNKPSAEAQEGGDIFCIAMSPDGELIATAGTDKVIRLWNAKTLTQKLVLDGFAGPIHGLAFDPTGQRLASVGWDKNVRIWDIGGGQLIKSWQGHDAEIVALAYSPDGKKLGTGGEEGTTKVWNAETGELLGTYIQNGAVHAIAFSADGSLLASGGSDGAVKVWKIR